MITDLDLYALLGVEPSASRQLIKKAYRRQAMKYHPDKNPGNNEADEQFKLIHKAFEILYDERKRAAYDHLIFQQKQNSFQNQQEVDSYYQQEKMKKQDTEADQEKKQGDEIGQTTKYFEYILFPLALLLDPIPVIIHVISKAINIFPKKIILAVKSLMSYFFTFSLLGCLTILVLLLIWTVVYVAITIIQS